MINNHITKQKRTNNIFCNAMKHRKMPLAEKLPEPEQIKNWILPRKAFLSKENRFECSKSIRILVSCSFFLRYVPESTRYLLLKGNIKETESILRNIAATNKKEYPEEPLYNPSAEGKVQQLGDVRDLFRTKKMCHRTLISWYAW